MQRDQGLGENRILQSCGLRVYTITCTKSSTRSSTCLACELHRVEAVCGLFGAGGAGLGFRVQRVERQFRVYRASGCRKDSLAELLGCFGFRPSGERGTFLWLGAM